MLRVLIADDHPLVRKGLVSLINDAEDLAVVAEADDYPTLLHAVAEHRPDVLVMDVHMPGGDAQSALRQVRQAWPEVAPLVLSLESAGDVALELLRVGARGFVSKTSSNHDLLRAVRVVGCGGTHVSEALAARLQEPDAPAPHHSLSKREAEVFLRLAAGERPTDIAQDLDLSIKTVSTHKRRLMAKLGVETGADLVRYALERGLV